MVQLPDFNVHVHHFTSMILICLSIALYFICPHVYHEFARISICWFASTYHICPNVYSTMPFLLYKCTSLHKYLYIFTIDYCCNNLLYVTQLYFLLVLIHFLYLACLVYVSFSICFFLRYMCITAAYKVVNYERVSTLICFFLC